MHALSWGLEHLAMPFARTFLTLGSTFSLPSLFSAMSIAVCFLILRRSNRNNVEARVLGRALFPRKLFTSASCRADACFFLLNTLLGSGVLGLGVLSGTVVSNVVRQALTGVL